MKEINRIVATAILPMMTITHSFAYEKPLSFIRAVQLAQANDPWLIGSRHQQQSLELLSYAATTQPAPKISIAFSNLPTDGFDFNQEGMTQFKVGVSQTFARGNSLAIRNQQFQLESQQQPLNRQDRKNKVAVIVGSLWLDLFRVQQSIHLINKNRNLFEQLSQLAEASYSSGLGKTRQHDIVRSQLELTRLEDKLNQLMLEQNRYQGMLEQWLSNYHLDASTEAKASLIDNLTRLFVSSELPELALDEKSKMYDVKQLEQVQLALMLSTHPSVKAIDKKIAATRKSIDLAEQKHQPQWGVNASYGYRADDTLGNSRADLFSLGVVFDVPLFTNKRQDNEVKSAISNTEATKTEKLLLIRQLMSTFISAKGRLLRVRERKTLYTERLLPQIHDQAQASLTAYTNNDGDFAEVVRARIAELNAEIDFLGINVQQQKIILEINYLFANTVRMSDAEKSL
jgi:outer membrane protein TolC